MAITTRRIVKTATLPLIPLRGMVVFPRMLLHFEIGREKSALALRGAMDTDQTVFLVAQKNLADADPSITGLYATGVVAKICQVLKTSGDTMRVLVEGLYRAKVTEVIKEDPFMLVTVRERPEPSHLDSLQEEALVRRCRVAFSNYADLAQEDLVPDVMLGVAAAEKAGKKWRCCKRCRRRVVRSCSFPFSIGKQRCCGWKRISSPACRSAWIRVKRNTICVNRCA